MVEKGSDDNLALSPVASNQFSFLGGEVDVLCLPSADKINLATINKRLFRLVI
jgi:hypothetical protein